MSGPWLSLTLPYPPSANVYWRYIKGARGGMRPIISREARAYRKAVTPTLDALKLKPLEGEVELILVFYRPRRQGDLDNRLKVTLDVLKGYAYVDDEQVVAIHAFRQDDKKFPRVELQVWEKNSIEWPVAVADAHTLRAPMSTGATSREPDDKKFPRVELQVWEKT